MRRRQLPGVFVDFDEAVSRGDARRRQPDKIIGDISEDAGPFASARGNEIHTRRRIVETSEPQRTSAHRIIVDVQRTQIVTRA
jgi:hypothetical protein